MKFKYEKDYKELKDICPPSNYKKKDITSAFRWVFDSIDNNNNFISQYHKNPKRFLNKSDFEKCSALALSFFNSLDGAKSRFVELKESIGETICLTLGTKIANGSIKMNDGVSGEIEKSGHFNYHPSKEAKFETTFKIVDDLK